MQNIITTGIILAGHATAPEELCKQCSLFSYSFLCPFSSRVLETLYD